MGLAILILGLVVFLGVHVLTSLRDRRAKLVERLGVGPYKALYSVLAIIGFVLIVVGFGRYRATGWVDIWYPPSWIRQVAAVLVWPAFIFVVAAYIRGDIARKLKHPMLVGIKLWAVAHLMANGDLGSIILFGSVLAWAVHDRAGRPTVRLRTRQAAVTDGHSASGQAAGKRHAPPSATKTRRSRSCAS